MCRLSQAQRTIRAKANDAGRAEATANGRAGQRGGSPGLKLPESEAWTGGAGFLGLRLKQQPSPLAHNRQVLEKPLTSVLGSGV